MNKKEETNLCRLAMDCGPTAQKVAELLRTQVTEEADEFLNQGYIVPGKAVWRSVADIFERIGARPGSGSAIRLETTDQQRLNMICAFGAAIMSMEEQVDIGWSSQWGKFRERTHQRTCEAAIDILHQWNSGQREALMVKMKNDVEVVYNQEVYDR